MHASDRTEVAPPSTGWFFLPALLFGLALWGANLLLGNLNQDEGWYLLAALRTARGQLPYRDFFFTQGPVMPLVYGALSPLWAPAGLLGGRLLTGLCGLLAVALAAALAARLAPPRHRAHAALCAWLFTACAPVHGYFSVLPKTYSLAALFLLGGFARLARGRAGALSAGLLLGLAAATRISLAPALPCVLLVLWFRRAEPDGRQAWLRFGLGAGAALALTYGVALAATGEAFLFAQRYHATRNAGGAAAWLALRAGFASRTLQAYPLLWLVALGLLACALRGRRLFAAPSLLAAAGWTAAAVTLLHALSPFPYDDYQTPVMPLLAAVAAAAFWRGAAAADPSGRWSGRLLAGFCGAALLLAMGSPLLMEWQVIRKDRFWFQQKTRPDLLVLRDAGRWIRARSPAGSLLLTQDAYLAVEAGRDVPPGLEMGPFSLFPGLADEEARRHHLHTPATLRQAILASEAPLAATSGYSFALACPGTDPLDEAERQRLLEALARRYEPVRSIPDFGQAHTTLTLWRLRANPDPDRPATAP